MSVTYYVNSPNVYGKTVQNGVPSPDTPVKLESPYYGDKVRFVNIYNDADTTYEYGCEVAIPNGLSGIPVSSGGNYIDENGQRWICDEIDFARGVYIQRVGTRVTTKSTSWYKNGSANDEYIGTNNIHVYINISGIDQTVSRVLCDKLGSGKSAGKGNEKNINVCANVTGNNSIVVDVDKTRWANLDEWKAYVAENPLTIKYPLATPVETELTIYSKSEYSTNGVYRQRMNSYYPQVVQSIQEFQSIIGSEYPEFDYLSHGVNRVIEDAYLTTMSEERVYQWEKILGIVPISGSTVSDRRDTIVARIRGQGKLNTELINSIVGAFTGGTANSWVKDSVLYVEITPPPENKLYQFSNIEQELKHKLPAHLGFQVSRNYLEWGEVKNKYTTWQNVKDSFETWEDVYLFSPFNQSDTDKPVPSTYILTADDFTYAEVTSTGALANGYVRIATKNLVDLNVGKVSINCPSPYQYFVYFFTDNDESTYIGKTTWKSGSIDDVLKETIVSGTLSGAKYCRISLRDSSNSSASLNNRLDEFVANITVLQELN